MRSSSHDTPPLPHRLPHPPPFLTLASLPVPPLLLPLHACCILFRVILFWFSVNLSRNLSKFQGLEFEIRVRPALQSCSSSRFEIGSGRVGGKARVGRWLEQFKSKMQHDVPQPHRPLAAAPHQPCKTHPAACCPKPAPLLLTSQPHSSMIQETTQYHLVVLEAQK